MCVCVFCCVLWKWRKLPWKEEEGMNGGSIDRSEWKEIIYNSSAICRSIECAAMRVFRKNALRCDARLLPLPMMDGVECRRKGRAWWRWIKRFYCYWIWAGPCFCCCCDGCLMDEDEFSFFFALFDSPHPHQPAAHSLKKKPLREHLPRQGQVKVEGWKERR